jgi:hypothetical protein
MSADQHKNDLPKAYEPAAIEARWAKFWVQEELFSVPPPPGDTRAVFSLLLPPPNVTGRLHMGHMLNQTQMDIITRWHRMRAEVTLWLPGTDHAGIATQMMVERQLAIEGQRRQNLGREKFIERVWEWKKLYGGAIGDIRRLRPGRRIAGQFALLMLRQLPAIYQHSSRMPSTLATLAAPLGGQPIVKCFPSFPQFFASDWQFLP